MIDLPDRFFTDSDTRDRVGEGLWRIDNGYPLDDSPSMWRELPQETQERYRRYADKVILWEFQAQIARLIRA